MAVRLPLLLRRLRPALAHFVHSLPLGPAVPRRADGAGPLVRARPIAHGPPRAAIFKIVVPRSARRARARARDLRSGRRTISSSCTASPRRRSSSRRSPATPRSGRPGRARRVPAVRQLRRAAEGPAAALDAAQAVGMPLVVVGPQRTRRSSAELRDGAAPTCAATCRRTSSSACTSRRRRCLVHPTRYEGFGLTCAEAMACGTPVVATAPTRPCARSSATRRVPTDDIRAGVREALADRDEAARAGLARARLFTWERDRRAAPPRSTGGSA